MKCSLTRIIRRLASLLLLSSGIGARFAHAQATLPGTILWPGEVAVVGYTATGPAPDFAFVPLVALAPGTQLRLTNNGWQAVGSFRPGETTITYTVPAAGVVKGKVITYSANKTSFSGPLPLAATGDQLLIYQGPDLTPTFVAALNYGPGGFTDATSAATTALPPGLTLGNSALALPTQPTGYYAGATRAGLPVDLRAALTAPANWTGSDARLSWPTTAFIVSEGLVPDAQELAALKDFYQSAGGVNWVRPYGTPANTVPWDFTGTQNAEHWATWFGMQTAGGDVTALNFNSANLRGTLPATLGNLKQLTFLNMPWSPGLTGSIPTSIGQLVNLTYLRTNNSSLVSPLPASMAQLKKLQYLYLNSYYITGPIPAWLGSLTSLLVLNLRNTHFTGTLPPELGKLVNLQQLEIANNNAQDTVRGLQLRGGIPDTYQNLTKLTRFNISDLPNIKGPIPAWLGKLTQLQLLCLDDNGHTGGIPPEIVALPQLNALLLYQNKLTDLPPRSAFANPAGLIMSVQDNRFEFGGLENHFTAPGQFGYRGPFGKPENSGYLPQTLPTDTVRLSLAAGQALTLPSRIGGMRSRYQWQRLAAGTWQDLPSDSAASRVIASATYPDAGTYRCRVVNSWVTGLTLYSKPTVLKWVCPALRLRLSPSTAVELGNSATLKATVPGTAANQGTLTFAWSPADGLSSTTAALVGATPRQTTTYTCVVRDVCGQTATAQVTVRVNPVPALINPPVEGVTPPALVNAQPPSRATAFDSVNFVRTYTPRVALTDTAAVRLGSKAQVQVSTQYFDGLGRPVQTVLRQESPRGNDIIQPVAYDGLGRSPRQYQPYASPNLGSDPGQYRPDALRQQYDFYRQDPATTPLGPGNLNDNVAPTGVAYAETVFESSPLNRVLQQAAPGESWSLASQHQQQRLERPNTDLDSIPRYTAAYGATAALANGLAYQGLYPAGELWTTEVQDEHGFRTREYKDKLGQVVAKRVECPRPGSNGGPGGPGQAGVMWLSTYYVYDDFSHLRCVIPPKASAGLPKATPTYAVVAAVEPLLFRYRYDGRAGC